MPRPSLLNVLTAGCVLTAACGDDGGAIAGHEVREFAEYVVDRGVTHTSEDVDYPQTPPVSGPHYFRTSGCGAFDEPIPDEIMVHTLEHGAVGILFDPGVDAAEQEAIGDYVDDGGAKLFSAPYEGLPDRITVISWRRTMELEAFDAEAVDEYVERYENDAPEAMAPC